MYILLPQGYCFCVNWGFRPVMSAVIGWKMMNLRKRSLRKKNTDMNVLSRIRMHKMCIRDREETDAIIPVIDAAGLCELQREAGQVFVQDAIYDYIVQLVTATRTNPYIELGLSPRGTIACAKMAKAWAFLQGRDYVLPEDVEEVFPDVARHRIVLNTRSRAAHVTELQVIAQILKEVPQPTVQK